MNICSTKVRKSFFIGTINLLVRQKSEKDDESELYLVKIFLCHSVVTAFSCLSKQFTTKAGVKWGTWKNIFITLSPPLECNNKFECYIMCYLSGHKEIKNSCLHYPTK